MKIRCDRNAFAEGLQAVSGFIPVRTPQDVLKNVKITAGGDGGEDGIIIYATDLEMSASYAVAGVEIAEPGVGLFPHDKLFTAVSKGLDESIELSWSSTGGRLVLSDAEYDIAAGDPETFPDVPVVKPEWEVSIQATTFRGMIDKVIYAAATEQTRYAFNAINVSGGKSLRFVASDGHRLAMIEKSGKDLYGKGKTPAAESVAGIKETLIPPRVLRLVKEALVTHEKVVIGADAKNISIKTEDGAVAVTSRLIDGHYPNYREVIPKNLTIKVRLSRDLFLKNLERAGIFYTTEQRAVTMSFSGGELLLEGGAPDLGSSNVRMSADYEGKDFKIKFDLKLLVDVLRVLDEDTTTIEFKTADDAGMIKEGDAFTYVVMPMNLK